ncbi:hypothetical protein MKX03_009994 [Papaver bracteatum]|nr:hypothetical protein MKX03_009994 [Papaver bracteatum]
MAEKKSVAEVLDEQVLRVKQLPSPDSCIFKVPQVLRVHDEAAYKPEIIAIGPYNRMDKNLHSMEDHKIRYFKALLDRRPFIRSSDLVAAVEEVKFQAAECYHDICSASDDFVKTMVLDGCFILELLVRHADEVASAYKKDPIFSSTWILCSLQHDLILLENQIPYIVLLKLYSLTIAKYRKAQASDELNKLVVCFFQSMLPCLGETDSRTQQQPRHILDLLRINLLPKTTRTVEEVDSPSYELPRCISDLKEAGVCLKKRQVSDGVLDIQFNNGYLEIPSFYIDENTDVLLRNMIAFEQCDGKSTHEITSYGLLLQNLMNSEKDVKILSDEGIINTLGNNKELALKINSMCKGVCIVSFCYEGLCRECNLYASQYWPRKRTTLAGICCLVLLLTILHTFYAILAYQ